MKLSKEKVLLIEDDGRWHNNKKGIIYSEIIREYLPAYSPELELAKR